jgi:DNA topoisomerase VI subunit A
MSELKNDLTSAIESVAKEWKKAKRRADKQDRVSSYTLNRMRYRPPRTTIREVAFDVMEAAYMKASADGHYPANARQIYYAARPFILKETGEEELSSQYFTQTLLKDYMDEYDPPWDIVFDARGHITEPHTGEVIGLGGLEVRHYIEEFTDGKFDEAPKQDPRKMIETRGPGLRYGAVLFIEKEGFDPLLKAAKIAERFDVAIASTKGMPVSAACDLLADLKLHGRKVYVIHDFDKSGFSIVATLRRGTRGSRGTGEVVDLGFRFEDITGLERERVKYPGDPRWNLEQNGATDQELQVLVQGGEHKGWWGERVELNAMTSGQFVEWIERKLREHGVKKLIPDNDALAAAYRRGVFLQRIHEEEAELRKRIAKQSITVPRNLVQKVTEGLRDNPELAWDEIVWEIAENHDE